ncbi:Putative major facilitator superfamily, MFS transporter superfamily [Septoria linicola]|uniref:Major facilitator superfamily, MFS transporter superfamily n=1 Tax=Septoria linicola TaxID=215465 RepID=A0A9Q9EMM2_9PEZI|nr:putative major facilitator superfamily, MFS transporter superfamily [Septoria linicola]USW56941.1 Putative major facilitator superfamily, MFS transporter superfamily [Septoria linicola]
MADIKDDHALEKEIALSSEEELEKAAVRRNSIDDIEDPDPNATPEERAALDKALMRKVDLWLIPWLCLLYLLSFLDRTNIGNARAAGMEADLDMEGHDYNNTLTIFFISYALAEPVTNVLLKRLTPRVFFTSIILLWGLVSTLMGVVHNYEGLLAARFFLGLAEAGLFPGVNYYLSCWYKRSELGLRAATFFSAAALAGSFGGLLAAAIAKLDGAGGRPGWAWIFIIEGLATMAVGAFCWWMVFDWPDTARFLSPQERLRVRRRLAEDKQSSTGEEYDKRHIIAALKDWKCWGYALIYMGNLCPLYSFSLFLPTILAGMGYSGTRLQLLSVPPYAVAACMTIIIGYIGDRTKQRGLCNMFTVSLAIVGFTMLLASSDPTIKYAGTFLGAAGIYPTIPNTLTWASNNIEGVYKRGVIIGIVVGWGNLNGVVSSNIYLVEERPRYWTGHGTVLAYLVVCLLGGTILMYTSLRIENNKRRSGKRDNMHAGMTRDEIWVAGDNRPDFIYTL